MTFHLTGEVIMAMAFFAVSFLFVPFDWYRTGWAKLTGNTKKGK